jgi:hypothetical protein
MKLEWIIVSITHLIHACMEEALYIGVWKGGWVEDESTSCLGLQEERATLLCGWCGWLMPLLDRGWHWNCQGVASHMGFLSIIFMSLLNVQQFGSSIAESQMLHKERNINVFTLMCDVCSPILTHVHRDIGWGWLTFYHHRWTVG